MDAQDLKLFQERSQDKPLVAYINFNHAHNFRLAGYGAQLLIDALVQLDVGEAFDSISADPCPGSLPSDRIPGETDQIGAL